MVGYSKLFTSKRAKRLPNGIEIEIGKKAKMKEKKDDKLNVFVYVIIDAFTVLAERHKIEKKAKIRNVLLALVKLEMK